MKIKFNKLVPNDYNPRKLFRSASLEELKKSINSYGLIEPLVVRPINDNKYEVICGMRRYYALKDLGINEVECSVKDLNDTGAIDLAFMENVQREDLTPIEEGKMYLTRLKIMPEFKEKELSELDAYQKTQLIKELSDLYSIGESSIRNRLSLLTLPENLQNAIENKNLPLTVAYEIARLNQIEDRDIANQSMLEMYDDFKLEKDTISLSEINARITNKIDYFKSRENEQKIIAQQRIKDLQKKIKETEMSKKEIFKKLEIKIKEIYENEFFIEEDFPDIGDIEDLKEELMEKCEKFLDFLEIENEKFATNELYEDIVDQINEIENNTSDIRLLITRAQEKDIRVCPFCYAKIDLPAIRRQEKLYFEQLEDYKKQRSQIAGIKGFITDSIKQIDRFKKTIEKKDEFIEKFNLELEEIDQNV